MLVWSMGLFHIQKAATWASWVFFCSCFLSLLVSEGCASWSSWTASGVRVTSNIISIGVATCDNVRLRCDLGRKWTTRQLGVRNFLIWFCARAVLAAFVHSWGNLIVSRSNIGWFRSLLIALDGMWWLWYMVRSHREISVYQHIGCFRRVMYFLHLLIV